MKIFKFYILALCEAIGIPTKYKDYSRRKIMQLRLKLQYVKDYIELRKIESEISDIDYHYCHTDSLIEEIEFIKENL